MISRNGLLEAPGSSYRSGTSDARLLRMFSCVRAFVVARIPTLGKTGVYLDCPKVHEFRKVNRNWTGDRAVMHVGHVRGKVCSARLVGALADPFIVGLFLHEFGHLAGGESELAANQKIRKIFGIRIRYAGPMGLERVSPKDCRAILGR